ncbi:protein MpPPR_45 [Marchantia polymorpha subsp. ruderalis]
MVFGFGTRPTVHGRADRGQIAMCWSTRVDIEFFHGSTLSAGVSVRSDSSVSEIALGKVTDPLGFYDWMKKHPSGLEANRPMYALLQCHLQKRHWAGLEIIIMYKMGSKKNCLADAALYKKMIKIATDYGNTKLANKWLQKMLWSGFVPSLLTWNLVLVAFARDGRFAEVFSVYEQLKDHNRPPERIIYCALLSACQNADRVQEAQDIVAHMKCRGMLDSATATFREMEKAGYEPDQVAYNALIHAYARADANDAFDQAIKLGGRIDPVVFSTMINIARDLLEAMKEFRFEKKHWQCVVSILIKTYAKVGQLWEPIKLFEEMHAVGYPVNNRIHTTMLNVYFKVGRHRCAEALFLDMIETGKCRNMVAFGTMINIYGRMGRCRLKGNTAIYNTLIYCHGRNGNLIVVEEYVK